ncbi:MAG: hypothetical protein BZ138_07545 [Methanosphaera sp. rholeuAM270]|nr:MAG: hypothetical protein BZ138_07545 [Methanosphaera sp. rholeuAM270]
MDSKKFKKVNKDAPKLKHKKKKTQIHYGNIFKLLIIILVVILGFSMLSTIIGNYKLPDNAELIYPSQFNFTPYGYEWNKDLYGYCIAEDANDSQSRYYFTLSQMAALADYSDNSFNYSRGLYVNYTYDERYNVIVVDRIFDSNKNEIVKFNYDEYDFSKNARFLCRNSSYCTDDFGFTPEEYADSIFTK